MVFHVSQTSRELSVAGLKEHEKPVHMRRISLIFVLQTSFVAFLRVICSWL